MAACELAEPLADQKDTNRTEWLNPPVEEEGLRRYVEIIRERLFVVVLAVAVTTGIAILYVSLAPKTYKAQAELLVTPVTVSGEDVTLRSLPLIFASSDPVRDVETASQFVNLNVAERVKSELKSSDTPRALLSRVSAEPVAQSNIVAITAKEDSPEKAQDLANAFAQQTIEDRTDEVHDAIETILPPLQAQLAAAPGTDVEQTLAAQIAQLQTLASAPDPSIRVQTEADLPQAQSSPKPALSIAGGLFAGLILGVSLAFASNLLDPRVRREAQLRRLYRLPILGRIPDETSRHAGRVALGPQKLSTIGAEAYRTLRSTLEASRQTEDGPRVITVTSSSPSEGKSTTALNLASSLALVGHRVILIEADLRRPALAEALNIEHKHGIVQVLTKEIELEDALSSTREYGKNLQLLLAGVEGGWIADLFSSSVALEMIERARALADYVVIDSPPLNVVIDALPLARVSDDVLMVVRLGRTRLDQLAQLAELLAENSIRPAGFVVIGVARPRRGLTLYYGSSDGDRPQRSPFGATRRTGSRPPSRRRAKRP